MTDKKVKVIPYMVYKMCDCGGEYQMNINATSLMSYQPKYVHICNKCGSKTSFNETYPRVEYEEDRRDIEESMAIRQKFKNCVEKNKKRIEIIENMCDFNS